MLHGHPQTHLIWHRVARDVSGRALPCGHYIPEEAPQALLEEIDAFFDYRQPA
ncbi:Haloacetate dehalogenase H-1 (EC 3.8.1.3) [Mycetohabitans rhizoxinica HKI 454]|uniref:Haloacetate dehalogenase H-1 n=1 Tax=Mycetohabitans rhizoxinica (strain DSM 19002 / CIP 109453 / HKI 454) TaxID=882378 RepID=E5AMM7_MYCRK|nr:Haloacetate dehalogenase H-1 (EC 3.8.1.3) [Mycetohabitans rhizoxinica HKI 454]